ncbi:hypothetical protein F5Y02DRAFT_70031 [Annulohypoxylon stygium]|nr:hypothetical protein F5Y02DRAFT_70031 [Annulohypoxylon stygium]
MSSQSEDLLPSILDELPFYRYYHWTWDELLFDESQSDYSLHKKDREETRSPTPELLGINELPPIEKVLKFLDTMAPVETRSHVAPGSAPRAPARDTIHVPTTERPSNTPPAEPRGSTSGPPESPDGDDDDDNDPDNDPKGKGPERHVSLPPPEGIAYIELPQAKAYKPINPKPYSGEKTEDLDAFVTQLRIYMFFYS